MYLDKYTYKTRHTLYSYYYSYNARQIDANVVTRLLWFQVHPSYLAANKIYLHATEIFVQIKKKKNVARRVLCRRIRALFNYSILCDLRTASFENEIQSRKVCSVHTETNECEALMLRTTRRSASFIYSQASQACAIIRVQDLLFHTQSSQS